MPKTKGRRRQSKRRGISRIDQESTRTHGFFVRSGWYRRRDGSYGPKHRAFFGDVSYGGKKGALRAAEAWLAQLEKTGKATKPKPKVARKRG